MITNFYKNVNESFLVAHFALQNTKFGSEKGKVQKPARIPPQTPSAGGMEAEAGQFHPPRKIVCPAESKLVFRVLLKKSSNINQKTPPIFRIGGEGGIRTHERISPLRLFENRAFNHSATSPFKIKNYHFINQIKSPLNIESRRLCAVGGVLVKEFMSVRAMK